MIYYAIGDIHGEADKLRRLHVAILERIAASRAPSTIVHLGDYINRGPDSAGAVRSVRDLEAQLSGCVPVVSLMGNHDDRTRHWTPEKARTRGLTMEDVAWLTSRPVRFLDTPRRLAFVHAGIDPETFPDCSERIFTRTRSPAFLDGLGWPARLSGWRVIHGHTVEGPRPVVRPHRIGLDTGACHGGPLTAAVLREGEAPEFVQVR